MFWTQLPLIIGPKFVSHVHRLTHAHARTYPHVPIRRFRHLLQLPGGGRCPDFPHPRHHPRPLCPKVGGHGDQKECLGHLLLKMYGLGVRATGNVTSSKMRALPQMILSSFNYLLLSRPLSVVKFLKKIPIKTQFSTWRVQPQKVFKSRVPFILYTNF